MSEYERGRRAGIEEAARVVDACNKAGPYQAIGAAAQIRALAASPGAEEGAPPTKHHIVMRMDEPFGPRTPCQNCHSPRCWGCGPPRAAPDSKDDEPPKRRSCNRHEDCDAADAEAKARFEEDRKKPYREQNAGLSPGADHCHDECCEDCFGS